jgi:segregation and condensation protein A
MALESMRIARDVRLEERFKKQKPELVWTLTLADFGILAQDSMSPKEIPSVGLAHMHAPRVSIREQAAEVVAMLKRSVRMTFRELIGAVKDRAIVVARFLSVLELYRLSAITFEQDTPLGDINIAWDSENFDDEKLANLGADYDS